MLYARSCRKATAENKVQASSTISAKRLHWSREEHSLCSSNATSVSLGMKDVEITHSNTKYARRK